MARLLDNEAVFLVRDTGLGGYRRCVVRFGQGVSITVQRRQSGESDEHVCLDLDDLEQIVRVGRVFQGPGA